LISYGDRNAKTGFRFDLLFQVRAEGVKCQQIRVAAEQVFEKKTEVGEVAVRLFPLGEIDQQIDVARHISFTTRKRSEQANPACPHLGKYLRSKGTGLPGFRPHVSQNSNRNRDDNCILLFITCGKMV